MILVKLNIQVKIEVMGEFEGNEEERKENTQRQAKPKRNLKNIKRK
jgi:hypothetical protein